MRKFLLALLAAGICASAGAVTIDNLLGKTVAVVLSGNNFQFSLPVATSSGTFSKVNNSTVRLSNFYDGFGSNFTLNGDKLALKLFTGDDKSPFFEKTYAVFSMCNVYNYTAQTDDGTQVPVMCWEYGPEDESWVAAQYSGDPDGLQGWGFQTSGKALLLELMDVSQGTSNATLVDIQCFNAMQVYTYPTNATATEYQGSMMSDMYNVDVEMADGKITIKNFLNQGLSYQADPTKPSYSLGFVNGTIDENGFIEIPIQEIAGDVDYSALFDGSAADAWLGDGLLFEGGPTGYWFVYQGTSYYPWQLIDYSTFDSAASTAAAVTGSYSSGSASHSGKTRWVGFGGDCVTNVKGIIDLGPAGVYASYYNDIIGSADRTVIEFDNEQTADVEVRIAKGNYYGNNANVMGFLTTKVNSDNVDHYDVYAVSGRYGAITDPGFDTDNATGHREAILVYDGSNEAEKDYTFSASFEHKEQSTGAVDYTYFVKTNYTAESGLEPTFHALTPYSMANSAAEIEATDAARVTAADGIITIAGTDAEATVYNAAGAVVYQGLDREIPATPGVYVVRLGSTVVKVVL